MAVQRIQVYADADTKRRIERAAAKRHLRITSYCLEAIMQQLGEDEMMEQERIEVSVNQTADVVDTPLLAQMRELRERIKARRGGSLITIDIVEQVRAERDEELDEAITGLR